VGGIEVKHTVVDISESRDKVQYISLNWCKLLELHFTFGRKNDWNYATIVETKMLDVYL